MSDQIKPISQHEQLRQLANSALYVLQHSYYRGEDSHLVELVKAWMKSLRDDVATQIAIEAKKATEEANKPEAVTSVEAVTTTEAVEATEAK